MKKAFSLSLADRQQAATLLPLIAEAGFDGVEPTFRPGGVPDPEHWQADAEWLRAEADKVGLAIPSMRGGPGFWPSVASADPADRDRAVRLAEAGMACVKAMGGDVLLVVPGRCEPHLTYAAAMDNVRDTTRRFGDIADRAGITIGLENVENRLLFSPTAWCELIDELAHPRVRMYYDVGNTVWLRLGYSPQWIRELGHRIVRVHFKDAVESERVTTLLEGDVDWPGVRQAFREIGYDGWIAAELNLYAHCPERLLQRTARDMDAIWGLGS